MPRRNPRTGRRPKPRRTATSSAANSTVDDEGLSISESDFESDFDSDFDVNEEMGDDESAEEVAVPDAMAVAEDCPAPKPGTYRRGKRQREAAEGTLLWEVWEKENENWIDEFQMQTNEGKSDVHETGFAETIDPSPDILLPLLRFQREWLAWALKQEESETRGGILADEMGMGKTIQAISLVLTARSLRKQSVSSGLNADLPSWLSSSSSLPRTKCTLVVCPVVAVIQWVGEIERYTKKGSTMVLVYHGAKRANTKYNFDDYDFVITTYSTIEYDFRKKMMPPKEKCQWCGKMLYSKKMKVHLKYYCGPDACLTEKQAKQVSKKRNKYRLLEDYETSKGKKGAYDSKQGKCVSGSENEGPKQKKKQSRKTFEPDMPTNNVAGSSCAESLLHSVKWERVILDEAHFIKDRSCNTAKAIFALDSLYKWALSGTPLQNRVGELYSLVRFLQIYPFSYYLCKDCDCKVLDYGSSTHCADCSHSNSRHFCWWNKYITKPVQQSSMLRNGIRAMILLKDRVLKSIVLRRTKEGRAADLALPPRIVYLRRDSLDKNEQEFYEALYTQSRTQFDTYATAGTLLNNYAHVFDLLTRLRQAVDHPYLVVYSKSAEVPNASKADTLKQDCGICHDPVEDLVVTSCEHIFCKSCLIDYSEALGNVTCPTCSKPLTVDFTTNNPRKKMSGAAFKGYSSGILNRLNDVEAFRTSTKIDALKEEIREMVEADGSAKGIVFSQFTSFLDLIHFSLKKAGIKCVQLVGSMSLAERDKAIKAFTDDADCKIFLMSLKAGGVALNLTVASNVFLMDPWWNPAVEHQAQDRIHRIGQYKPIRIIRFVIEGTIEDRILKLQEKKELVFQGTIENSGEAMAKLTEADLRFLFQV